MAAVAALAPPAEERCRTVFSILAGGNPKLGGFGGRLERRLTEALTTGQGPGAPYGGADLSVAEARSVISTYRAFVKAETEAQGDEAPIGAKAKQASSVIAALPETIPVGAERIPDILDALSRAKLWLCYYTLFKATFPSLFSLTRPCMTGKHGYLSVRPDHF